MQLRRTTGGLASDGNDEDGTLHEANILPLEDRPLEKEIPNLETSIFREYVSFKECNDEDGSNDDPCHHHHYHYHLSWIMTMNIFTGLLSIMDDYDDLEFLKTYLSLLWKWSIFTGKHSQDRT